MHALSQVFLSLIANFSALDEYNPDHSLTSGSSKSGLDSIVSGIFEYDNILSTWPHQQHETGMMCGAKEEYPVGKKTNICVKVILHQ